LIERSTFLLFTPIPSEGLTGMEKGLNFHILSDTIKFIDGFGEQSLFPPLIAQH